MQSQQSLRVLFVKTTLDRSELDLVLRLHAAGVFVRVLTSKASQGAARLQELGIYIEPRRYRTKISVPLILQIHRLIRRDKITLIHATDTRSLANVVWATYFLPVRIVGYRGTISRIRKTDPGYWMGLLNPRVRRIFCVSRAIYDYMARFRPQEQLVLNYKGYDPAWAEEIAGAEAPLPGIPAGAFVVMNIGNTRGRPHKGVAVLVEAFHQAAIPGSHLVLIGDYDEDVPRRVSAGPMAASIHLLGKRAQAAAWLRHASVYVQPSTGGEGLPRSVKEAMAQSVPVVVTDIPGPSELIVDGESGCLVAPGDAAALAAVLRQLADNPERRQQLGAAGLVRLRSCFSAESFFDITLSTYRDVMQEPVR